MKATLEATLDAGRKRHAVRSEPLYVSSTGILAPSERFHPDGLEQQPRCHVAPGSPCPTLQAGVKAVDQAEPGWIFQLTRAPVRRLMAPLCCGGRGGEGGAVGVLMDVALRLHLCASVR